jgi:hypothetical protein
VWEAKRWQLLRPGQTWRDGEVTHPCELEVVSEAELRQLLSRAAAKVGGRLPARAALPLPCCAGSCCRLPRRWAGLRLAWCVGGPARAQPGPPPARARLWLAPATPPPHPATHHPATPRAQGGKAAESSSARKRRAEEEAEAEQQQQARKQPSRGAKAAAAANDPAAVLAAAAAAGAEFIAVPRSSTSRGSSR